MSAAPLQVLTRPFAIEPVTSIMLPDGIFDNAIYTLRIGCHFTNTQNAPLTNVSIYLESTSDPGIVPTPRTWSFATIPAGATVRVWWEANFEHASPGKPLVSFVANANGFSASRSIKNIFVSQTRFDPSTNSYTCTIEEGTLKISGLKGLLPRADWWRCNPDRPRCPPRGPVVPTGMTMVWTPNPAYAGVHGELPFADPWWKIVAWIVVAVSAVVAIVAAALGAGKASFSVGGTFEETEPSVHCCTPEGANSGDTEFTVAGVASAIASGAIVVGCSDAADPFWRGQEAAPPEVGELTVAERVVVSWVLPQPPNAGQSYAANVQWTYDRVTTGQSYSHSVTETQINQHVAGQVTVKTPATVQFSSPLWVKASVAKPDGSLFAGPELYAFALFRAPQGCYFVVDLGDDGLGFDDKPNDGVYSGKLDLEKAYRVLLEHGQTPYGSWRVFFYAQDVNLTKPGTPPHIAAQHIGGMVVASAIDITFDPSLPCPLKAQANITVV